MSKSSSLSFLVLIAVLFFPNIATTQSSPKDKVAEMRRAIEAGDYPNIDGILMARKGQLLVEEYFGDFGRDSLHDTRSAFKSVTSLLAGIAIEKGLFTVEDELRTIFPEWANDKRGSITIRDLLEMRSGLACEGFFGVGPDCESLMWETDDWLEFILQIPLRHEPGLNWEYTSMEPELLGIAIARTSNMSLPEFAKVHLFEPMGITDYEWYITPNGGGYAAGSFYMKPADMLKIAQLVLDKGNWQGKQLVSADWIDESTTCKIDVEMSFVRFSSMLNAKYSTANYGYLWYREVLQYGDIKTEALFASGNGGQYMMVLEDYDAALAFTGSNYGNWRGKLPFELVLQYLIPILEEQD